MPRHAEAAAMPLGLALLGLLTAGMPAAAMAQAAPAILLSPGSLDFGNVSLGTSSQPLTVTATNTGMATLVIGGVGATGDFNESNDCGTLAAGKSCSVNVTFTPTAAGIRTGGLDFSDNVSGSPQAVTLTGTGTGTGGSAGDVLLTPANGGSAMTTISPGQTATYYLEANSANEFTGTVDLSCAGAPQGAACTVNPTTVAVGNAAIPVSVTVTTSSGSMAAPMPPGRLPPLGWLTGFGLLSLAMAWQWWARRWNSARWTAGILTIAAVTVFSGSCGGTAPPSSATPLAATPPGAYTLTVTAAATDGTNLGQIQLALVVE